MIFWLFLIEALREIERRKAEEKKEKAKACIRTI
jgi:hypothetical protein